jgi:putative endonuclease
MLDHSKRRADGQSAERLAEQFLCSQGFRPIAANFLTRVGEIDLIMEDGPTLVFIEVKRRRNDAYGEPEESVTPAKCRRIVRSALIYLNRHGAPERLMRFDVVIIDPEGIRHIPNAFDAGAWFPL